MNEAERKFREDRALRNAAHALVKAQLGQVRNDLAAKGIGQRIADKASEGVKVVAGHSLDVANSHRGVIAGTFAALLLWLFRNPLAAGGRRLWQAYGPGGGPKADLERPADRAPEPWWRRLRFHRHSPEERSSD